MSAVLEKIDIDSFVGDGLDIIGTDGSDRLFGTDDGDFIDGRGGDDIIFGDDFSPGEGGNDLIIGGEGNDIIQADLGDDSIIGGEGNDIIQGGLGNDVIEGSSGNDTLIGNEGADVFGFDLEDFDNNDRDVIADFQLDEDTIVIRGLGEDDQIGFDSFTNGITINGNSVVSLAGSEVKVSDLEIEQDDDDGYIFM